MGVAYGKVCYCHIVIYIKKNENIAIRSVFSIREALVSNQEDVMQVGIFKVEKMSLITMNK